MKDTYQMVDIQYDMYNNVIKTILPEALAVSTGILMGEQ